MFFRQALTNVMDMLKPGGQLFFNAFQKVFTDDVFERLDQGRWSKYDHAKGISPFYEFDNPVKEYENVIKSVGFVDCHIFTQSYKPGMSEAFFKGKVLFCNMEMYSNSNNIFILTILSVS